ARLDTVDLVNPSVIPSLSSLFASREPWPTARTLEPFDELVMRRMGMRQIFALLLLAACAGCTSGKLEFQTLQLGRSLNPDNTVGLHATSFKPNDTIYVSVLTSTSGSGTISVRWT